MNLNGDYLSDALARNCVGGIGIAPGANIGDDSALFEAHTELLQNMQDLIK